MTIKIIKLSELPRHDAGHLFYLSGDIHLSVIQSKHKRPWTLYVLLVLLLFQGLGAIGGGLVLMIRPDGSMIHMPMTMLNGSIFPDFLIPGLILFLVLGVFPVFTFFVLLLQPQWSFLPALSIYKDRYAGWMFSLFIGLGLIIWMDVEVAIVGGGSVIQEIYAALGLLIVIFTLTPSVMRYYQRGSSL